MDKAFLEQQKNLAMQYLEKTTDEKEKRAVSIVVEFLSSLLNPENYTDAQKEDLRKLALELGYTEETDFNNWVSNIPIQENS